MFAYCLNNPVVFYDDGGHKPKSLDETIDDPEDDCFFPDNCDNNGAPTATQSQHLTSTVTSDYSSASQESLHRPYVRQDTRSTVEARADRLPDGRFIDANTGEAINGKYDLGHVYGHEFWREREMAMANGWTQSQFNDYMNNPDFYQIETPHWNRSHIFEMPK